MNDQPSASIEQEATARLPIDAHRDEIAALIRRHAVVIVCGETGSGKSTQLPQICLGLLGREQSRVVMTQPRRLAARSIAARIAAEMGTELGSLVGYQVRFDRRSRASTRLRVVTDGVLLAELASDPHLRSAETVIVDEAHERSINIDLLLGSLVRAVRVRSDLRVIITSATIDPERFSAHFGGAPIVEVSGRGHPIEIAYRPPPPEDPEMDPASPAAVVPAVAETLERCAEGDVLVFLPGEREIDECAEALRGHAALRGVEVLPLMARLADSAQDKVFTPRGPRRVVLATNVAETSLTVPRVRAVVDSGVARLRRYSGRSRVERLLVEPISQASAAQRAGRCGRIGPGLCLRLYSEEDLRERPERTTPEILRSDLAGVVLRMKVLGLGDPSSFPFLDPPVPRLWQDGVDTLVELGAIDRRGTITTVGRRMASMPLDPRLSRMIVAAEEGDCLRQVLVVAAALSVQDPIERSAEGAAVLPRHPDSDFLGLVRLWEEIQEAATTRGSSAMRRWCLEKRLSHRRVREWIEVHGQLDRLARRGGHAHHRLTNGRGASIMPPAQARDVAPAADSAVHRAILAGLVSRVGRRQDDGSYAAPQGGAFAIHRSSALARRTPTWIMAAEIVDTGRRSARTVARIQGDWIERIAPHLVRRQHSEPHWLPESGHVAAWEKVTFGSLVLIPRRRVPYEPIDPEGARNVFIHAALVDEGLRGDAPFLEHNRRLRERLEAAQAKRRDHGLLVDVEARFAFYDARIPKSVVNAASFDRWRRKAEARDPEALRMRDSDLLARPVDVGAFPDQLVTAAGPVPLRYHHAPGTDDDGVTMRVPIESLHAVDAESSEWLVPGMLEGKIEALIRSLPKRLRTRFVPVREYAQGAAESIGHDGQRGSLRAALASYLSTLTGAPLEPSDFDPGSIPSEFRMRFELIDHAGRTLESGRDLGALQRRWAARAAESFRERVREAASTIETSGHEAWDFPAVPERVHLADGAVAYPAVIDEGAGVGVRLLASESEAAEAMRLGLRRLVLLELAPPIEHHVSFDPSWHAIEARWRAAGLADDPREAVLALVAEHACLHPPLPRSCEALDVRLGDAAPHLHARCVDILRMVGRLVAALDAIRAEQAAGAPEPWQEAVESVRGHAATIAGERLASRSVPNFELAVAALEADAARLRALPRGGLERDREAAARLAPWAHRAAAALGAHPLGSARWPLASSLARDVERLRIALFNPSAAVLSAKSVEKALESTWATLA